MQWTGDDNGGFSRATKRRLTRPLPDGLFGPERVNAADQRRDHGSFWWFMRNLIYTYREQPETGWSNVEILKQPNRAVLAHLCREESGWAMVARLYWDNHDQPRGVPVRRRPPRSLVRVGEAPVQRPVTGSGVPHPWDTGDIEQNWQGYFVPGSPSWADGSDTGYSSGRTLVWQR
jgi:hypothetical protein